MFVDGDRHVSGRLRARVQVAVVLRHKIYVVEYDAVEGVLLEGLHETHVHQHASVERVVSCYKR